MLFLAQNENSVMCIKADTEIFANKLLNMFLLMIKKKLDLDPDSYFVFTFYDTFSPRINTAIEKTN